MKNLFFPFILFFFLLAALSSPAQSSFGWQTHYGTYLTSSPKADYLKDSYTFYNEVYYQQQTDGSKAWHHTNKLPQWGVAFFWGGTGSKRHMGHMAGLFPFMNVPLLKRRNFTSKLRGGMGIGWVQRPYDKISNHKNVLIGSHLNGYMGFVWQNELKIASRLHLHAGFSFSHLSNGGSTLPNLGLNIPALTFGVRYGGGETAVDKTFKNPFTKTKWQYSLFAGAGIKQAPWVESKRYLINTFTAEATKMLGNSSAVNAGTVLYYDRSLEVHPLGIPSLKQKGPYMQAGVYAAYEHHFGKLSVPLQLGAYVWNKDKNPLLFQNIGLRYSVAQNWKAQVLLKTHMGQADHIQVGVGYTLKR